MSFHDEHNVGQDQVFLVHFPFQHDMSGWTPEVGSKTVCLSPQENLSGMGAAMTIGTRRGGLQLFVLIPTNDALASSSGVAELVCQPTSPGVSPATDDKGPPPLLKQAFKCESDI